MNRPLLVLLIIVTAFWCQRINAEAIDVADVQDQPIGEYVHFLQESGTPLTLDGAMQAYADGAFTAAGDAYLDFGMGSPPVWLRFEVVNNGSVPARRRLTLATSWLDLLTVYVRHDGRSVASYRMGDSLPFADRPVDDRFFTLDQVFEPGRSTVYLRVETVDPMVLRIYLSSIEQAHARQMLESYTYGLLYGGLVTLASYNLMLFFSLGSRRYLLYALYLAVFVLMNAAYTGHGYRYLWPTSPHWQQWSNPVLMITFQLVGFWFATTFLNTRASFPRQYRMVIGVCVVFGLAEALAVATGQQLMALLLAFGLIAIFSVGILLLGTVSLRAGNKSAKYFLFASIAHVSTSIVTALTVLGFVPYTALGYRAVEIGMTLDAILLAMALADQFRISQAEKIHAETLAMVDPLTQMNNRRAFYELLQPCWNTGLRKRHAMSVVVLDIDHFKSVNDRYGHAGGDEVLRAVARVLRDGARDGDILARWGGEEFILFLDETSLDVAVSIAERLRRDLAAIRVELAGDHVSITASFGVAQARAGNASVEELISTADKYLYMAKNLGRNQVCSVRAAMSVA